MSTDPHPSSPAAQAAQAAASGPNTAPSREGMLSRLTRWVFIAHAALLAAQPFLAGAMLDAMSPEPQNMHRMVAMGIVAVALVQLLLALVLWKGKAGWPKAAFTGSAGLCALELVQFTIGHLSLAMSMHIPLGIATLALGIYLAVRYGLRPLTPA